MTRFRRQTIGIFPPCIRSRSVQLAFVAISFPFRIYFFFRTIKSGVKSIIYTFVLKIVYNGQACFWRLIY